MTISIIYVIQELYRGLNGIESLTPVRCQPLVLHLMKDGRLSLDTNGFKRTLLIFAEPAAALILSGADMVLLGGF